MHHSTRFRVADARKKTHSSACTNSASGTHIALVGAFSKCHLHIEQPAGLAQHADTPSAQVQTQRASRSTRACCGGALTREGQARAPIAPPRTRRWIRANTPCARVSLRLRAGFSAAWRLTPQSSQGIFCEETPSGGSGQYISQLFGSVTPIFVLPQMYYNWGGIAASTSKFVHNG